MHDFHAPTRPSSALRTLVLGVVLGLGIALTACAAWTGVAVAGETPSDMHDDRPSVTPDLFFEENRGQFPEGVAYVARGPGYRIVLDEAGARYELGVPGRSRSVRVRLDGGRAPTKIVASEPLAGRIHYYRGNDPARWIHGAPTFARVRLEAVYPGIDVVYRAERVRAEYDFVVAPGGDPNRIGLRFDGVDATRIDAEGRLVLDVGDDRLHTTAPVAYQGEGQQRQLVAVAFVKHADGRIAFLLGDYDRARPLVIDPVILDYSTSLGGSANDAPTGLAVGDDGTIYVSGRTQSADFLGGPGSTSGLNDVFVSRLSADGTQLLYTTFVGGSDSEFPLDIAVDAAGDAYVVTQTPSVDFPTLNAYDATLGGMTDYAILRLDDTGALTYASYYGGPGEEGAFDDGGIALAPNGDAYITGRTLSVPPMGIDLLNPFQTTCVSSCAFLAGFDTSASGAASFLYGSYVGGNSDDGGQDVEIDGAGDVYLFGFTDSTTGLVDPAQGFQSVTNNAGNQDNFLLVLDPSQAGLAQRVYSTYLGSPGAEAEPRGRVFVESPSAVFVTGATDGAADTTFPYTAGFPIKNAVQPTPGGMEDAYVAKIDTTQTGDASLLFSTFLGGTGPESGSDIAPSASGTINVVFDISTWTDTVAPLAEFAAFPSVRLVQLDATGQTIETATPLPAATRVAVDASDRVLVTGLAQTAFTELAPLPPSPSGGSEVFLGRFESLPLSGATLHVDATASEVGVGEAFAYTFTLTNNGDTPITDFTISGALPGGLSQTLSALCFGSITCQPFDPSDLSGPNALQPNERLTLFTRASAPALGSYDITSLTATTTPADPDPSDNSDGVDVDVVATPPASSALRLADFDAWGLSYDTGGFAIDTPRGVLATGNGVLDEAANFMIFDGQIPVYVADVYSRGELAIGFVERTTWTPSSGDGLSLLDIDSGFGTVDRVYARIELIGRGPVVAVELRSGDAFSNSVAVPGTQVELGLEPDEAFELAVDPIGQTATLSYGGQVIASGNPFSSVLSGGADASDVGDDMVISAGQGLLDLGGALFSDEPIPVPEPSLPLGLAAGLAGLAGLARRRRA